MPPETDTHAGQCARCAHVRRLRSARGSTFFLCRRAAGDPAWARYPELPMRDCPGFTTAAEVRRPAARDEVRP